MVALALESMERMTTEEERILKVYLTKTKAIQNESAFENWYSGRFDGDDGNSAFQHHLDTAHAWVAGYWMGWDAHRETVNKALEADPDVPRPRPRRVPRPL